MAVNMQDAIDLAKATVRCMKPLLLTMTAEEYENSELSELYEWAKSFLTNAGVEYD